MTQRYAARIARMPMSALFEARGTEAGLAAGLGAAGLSLPDGFNRIKIQPKGGWVLCLGPRRTVIFADMAHETALDVLLKSSFATVPDADVALVSDMFTGFEVSGEGADAVLAQGAPLDISDAAFPEGTGAGTELWGATVMLLRFADTQPGFHILVERSFADYLEHWLIVASGGVSSLVPGVMASPPPSWKPA